MADTDLVPFDAGTFGIADDAADGAAAGAGGGRGARDADRGGGALAGRSRDAHAAADGRIVAADGRSLAFGELTKGRS